MASKNPIAAPSAKVARAAAAAALKVKQAAERAEWRAAKATATDWGPGELEQREVHDCGVRCALADSPEPSVHLDFTYEKNRMRIVIGDSETLRKLADVIARALEALAKE